MAPRRRPGSGSLRWVCTGSCRRRIACGGEARAPIALAYSGAMNSPKGQWNSSITRVRPFFEELLAGDPSGATWIGRLTEAGSRAPDYPGDLEALQGELSAGLVATRPYNDRILGRTIDLATCFEYPVPPSEAFLRWLIENPARLAWPGQDKGKGARFGDETQERRHALLSDDDPDAQAAAQRDALAELARLGVSGSRRKWWAFEGFTEVDCWIETEDLLLLVEGKRTEPLSRSTDWFPKRSQLVRNLEVAGELARGRLAAVLLVVEDEVEGELDPDVVSASTPHLTPAARNELSARYLGQVRWQDLCAKLDVSYGDLPDTTAHVLKRLDSRL